MGRVLTPLPEVNETAKRLEIDVDSLALPVGLPLEQIGVDVVGIERATKLCGVSKYLITGDSHRYISTNERPATAMGERWRNYRRPNAWLAVNNKARRTRADDITDLYSIPYQTEKLSSQVTSGLRTLAIGSHLGLDGTHLQNLSALAMDLMLLAGVSNLAVTGEVNFFNAIMGGLGLYGRAGTTLVDVGRAAHYGAETELSLLGSFRLDKLALATGYISAKRFIAPITS